MSGINRFLSKREGKRNRDTGTHHHHPHLHQHQHQPENKSSPSTSSPDVVAKPVDPTSSADFYGLFDAHGPTHSQAEELKIKDVRQRIIKAKGVMLRDAQILWALRSNSAAGEADPACDLLLAMSDASEGIVTSFDPRTKLLGAQNRQGVTCYLDATLFSMFSRLDSFEAMLYNSFDDLSLNKLGFMLRLWVNLLRSGKLITADITKIMQETLAECGWEEAAELHQQDASEAFSFITGKLELPLLTLKMDIYHTGREDTADDHKFINERLLEVAIPADLIGQRDEITLEECLEDYFNNRIEVRRYMTRRSTLNSIRKSNSVHVETVELDGDSSPITPISSSPTLNSPLRPTNRLRTPSIIQERYIPRIDSGFTPMGAIDSKDFAGRPRAGSVRKEVMMPAWQFFSLIPWYTDNAPKNDAQVAAHFSSKRPILGLCLKRYSMTSTGEAVRLNTQIDIPIEIGVPHFIQDDQLEEAGALHGNFKLSLQSVVCHRGNSVHSGHYIALVRGASPPGTSESNHSLEDGSKTWMRFDDLAPHRVAVVDIEKALKEETPYLLFYQIAPIAGDPGHITSGEYTLGPNTDRNASVGELSIMSTTTNATEDKQPPSGRLSFEVLPPDDPRGRSPPETRRASIISFSDLPPEHSIDRLNVPANGASGSSPSSSGQSLSRAQSKSGDGLGRKLSKLARRSREVLPETVPKAEIHVTDLGDGTNSERQSTYQRPNLSQPTEPQKGHRREKSRGRLTRSRVRTGDKPDRECVVM